MRCNQNALHRLEQLSPSIWLWENVKPLQCFPILKPIVIQKTSEHENPHPGAFVAQIHSRIVPWQGRHVVTGYQQIRRGLVQPIHSLPQFAGSQNRISFAFQGLLKNRTYGRIGDQGAGSSSSSNSYPLPTRISTTQVCRHLDKCHRGSISTTVLLLDHGDVM